MALIPVVQVNIPQPSTELSLVCLNEKLELVSRSLKQIIEEKPDYYTLVKETVNIVCGKQNISSSAATESLSYLLNLGKELCQMRGQSEQKFRSRDISSVIANQLRLIKYILQGKERDYREYKYSSIQDANVAINMIYQAIIEYKRNKDSKFRQRVTNSFKSFSKEFNLPKKYPKAELFR